MDIKSSFTNPSPSRHPDSDQGRWRAIVELLDSQQYAQTIKYIREAKISFLERGDTPVANMLDAAKQLCLTCQQVQSEKTRHERASAEAGSREDELRQQLRSIINSLSSYPAAQLSERLETPLTPETADAEAQSSLRRRLGDWLASRSGRSGAAIPEPASETAEIQTEQTDGQIMQDRVSPDTISPPTEPETHAELVDEQSDENDLGIAKPQVDEESSAISLPESDEAEKREEVEIALVGSDRELLQGIRGLLQTAMDKIVISPEMHEEEKPREAEIFLAASDRELLQGIHESLLATTQLVTDSASAEDEGKDEQPAYPEKEHLSQPQLPQPATQKLVMGTADMAAAFARDPVRPGVPFLMVYTLGPFRVIQDDQPIDDWSGSKGKSVFKYLISRREQSVAKEVLMELFWPGADPDAARNNLNVVIYGLRKTLRNSYVDFSHILYQEDRYLLNPEIQIWLDFEAFSELFQKARELERSGRLEQAMQLYQAAELLYQGEFLTEDRYEDWLIHQRQELRDKYMSLLERLSRYYFDAGAYSMSITCCRQMLAVDSCHEDAHRQLMRFYYRQGQIHLALRQYHQCVEALKEELDIAPTAETTHLAEKIRQNRLF